MDKREIPHYFTDKTTDDSVAQQVYRGPGGMFLASALHTGAYSTRWPASRQCQSMAPDQFGSEIHKKVAQKLRRLPQSFRDFLGTESGIFWKRTGEKRPAFRGKLKSVLRTMAGWWPDKNPRFFGNRK